MAFPAGAANLTTHTENGKPFSMKDGKWQKSLFVHKTATNGTNKTQILTTNNSNPVGGMVRQRYAFQVSAITNLYLGFMDTAANQWQPTPDAKYDATGILIINWGLNDGLQSRNLYNNSWTQGLFRLTDAVATRRLGPGRNQFVEITYTQLTATQVCIAWEMNLWVESSAYLTMNGSLPLDGRVEHISQMDLTVDGGNFVDGRMTTEWWT